MNYKCWYIFFASLLVFACNNGNIGNENNPSSSDASPSTDISSSSAIAIEPSSSSGTASSGNESSANESSSSASVEPSSSSGSDGVSSSLATSSESSSPSDSSSSANASSSSSRNVISSSANNASSSANSVSSSSRSVSSNSGSSNSASSSSISSSSAAVVPGSSGSLSNGTRFTPDMLGLTPGTTTASVNLNWISERGTSTNKTEVRLLNANGGLVKTFTGTVANATTGKSHHKATMTDLAPGTSYKYSVSNNGTDWSYEYNYKTPPSGSVFTFAAVSDPQVTTGAQDGNTKPKANPSTTAQGWKDIVKRIAEKEASFILCGGDQVDGGITYKEDEYKAFFAPEELRNIPFAPTTGNHDLHTEHFYHFNMPNLTSSNAQPYSIYNGKSPNYYYLYNNLLIVVLSTGFIQKSDNTAAAITEYKKNIEAAKTAHAGKYDWLIVQHHKSTTSISAHSADEDVGFLIEGGFEKLMTDQGVDLVIAGHDHIHVRSHLMKWDAAKGYSVRSTDKGTVYLTLTTASGIKFYPPLYILNEGQENAGPFTEKYPVLVNGKRGAAELRKAKVADTTTWPISTAFFVKTTNTVWAPNYAPNYTIFEVNGKTIKATTRNSANDLVDEFTITPKGQR